MNLVRAGRNKFQRIKKLPGNDSRAVSLVSYEALAFVCSADGALVFVCSADGALAFVCSADGDSSPRLSRSPQEVFF